MFPSVDMFADGALSLYTLTMATVFLAVLVSLYCANFLRNDEEQESDLEKSSKKMPISFDDEEDEDDLDHDPEGIVSKLKTAQLRAFEAQLSEDQLEEEKRVEREQMAAIFELLRKQESELNTQELDESELSAQLGLYR